MTPLLDTCDHVQTTCLSISQLFCLQLSSGWLELEECTSCRESSPKSIAIVGAGSAGLASLKTLLDLPAEVRQKWDIVLYEQRRDIGGVW